MHEIIVRVEADINPTENEDKVKRAVENTFGNLELNTEPQSRGSLLVGKGKDQEALTKLHNLLKREKIRDAARAVLYAGSSGKSIVFYLNKQVAYAGHVSFSNPEGESPLGPVKVEVHCNKPNELIDWLAPQTSEGRQST